MRMLICCTLTAMVITTASAEPDKNSAAYLLPYCKEGLNITSGDFTNADLTTAITAAQCTGKYDATVVALALLQIERQTRGIRHAAPLCADLPSKLTRRQGLLVVLKYSEARPQAMQMPFEIAVMWALSNAWPCHN
jgi:Rap1a immunity proteins